MKPAGQLLQRLAGAYALGSLTPRARRRFESWLASDVTARRAWQQWEERLSGLARDVPPVRPQQATWQLVEKRLSHKPPRARPLSRWLVAAALLAALVLVVLAWKISP